MIASRILVAVELLSADSHAALDLVSTLVKARPAHVQLLHVVSAHGSLEGMVPGADDENPDVHEQERALEVLDRLATSLRSSGSSRVETFATPGDAGKEILRHAVEHEIDLICMGTRGRTGISRLLVGSVTGHVMKHATCRVAVVRVPDEG